MGFIIWALLGMLIIAGGIYCIYSKKEVVFGFWANTKTAPIEAKNINAYNKSLGKLWCAYGFFFILLGIPLLQEENSLLIIITMIGVILEIIIVIAVYTLKIEGKYRKK